MKILMTMTERLGCFPSPEGWPTNEKKLLIATTLNIPGFDCGRSHPTKTLSTSTEAASQRCDLCLFLADGINDYFGVDVTTRSPPTRELAFYRVDAMHWHTDDADKIENEALSKSICSKHLA